MNLRLNARRLHIVGLVVLCGVCLLPRSLVSYAALAGFGWGWIAFGLTLFVCSEKPPSSGREIG